MGVLLEDSSMTQEAFYSYSMALKFNPENVSALLNVATLIAGNETNFAAQIDGSIKERIENIEQFVSYRPDVWSLSRVHGYIKHPEEYLKRGWIWILSGQPGLAVSGMKKAIEMSPDELREPVGELLGDLMLLRHRDDAGIEIYEKMLGTNPTNTKALLGIARAMLRKGDYQRATEYIEKAEKSGASLKDTAIEKAVLLFASGKIAEARILIQEFLDIDPSNVRALNLLAEVLFAQNDQIGLVECLGKIQRIDRKSSLVPMYKGRLAWRQGDWNSAYKNFQETLRLEPANVLALEWLLKLDMMQRRRENAKIHARQMLNFKSDHFLANYIMGGISLSEGDLDGAEVFFRRSLQSRKDAIVLNDLAWVLFRKGLTDDAEKIVREAIEINNNLSAVWDTLGMILIGKGKLKEAEEAINKSLSIYPDDANVLLHRAQLFMKKGDKNGVREIITVLLTKRSRLSFTAQRDLKEMASEVGIKID